MNPHPSPKAVWSQALEIISEPYKFGGGFAHPFAGFSDPRVIRAGHLLPEGSGMAEAGGKVLWKGYSLQVSCHHKL